MLVVATPAADVEKLRDALLERARLGPIEVTLLLAAADDAGGRESLRATVERLRAAGLDAVGQLGEADPSAALAQAWDPAEYDEVLVATVAGCSSP